MEEFMSTNDKKWMLVGRKDDKGVYIPTAIHKKIHKSMKSEAESSEEYYDENSLKYVIRFIKKKSGLPTIFELVTYIPYEDTRGRMCYYRARD